ncbi:MAG TPA: hypothetical protein DIW81_23285 [Planctomycetaceae bacterium]|nr:hypothetical protein [Planctomycetaceae bacterium]
MSTRPLTGGVITLLRRLSQTEIADDFTPAPTIQQLKSIRHLMTALISQTLDQRPKMLAYLKY